MNLRNRSLFVLTALVATVAPALAVDTYSNFGPGLSFNNSNFEAFAVGAITEAPSFQFQATKSGSLTSLTVAISENSSFWGPEPFYLSLYNDKGSLLGSFNSFANNGLTITAPLVVGASGVNFVAGQNYSLQAVCPPGAVSWDKSFITGGGAFSVQVTPSAVPEPAPIAALGVGALGLMLRKRRK